MKLKGNIKPFVTLPTKKSVYKRSLTDHNKLAIFGNNECENIGNEEE